MKVKYMASGMVILAACFCISAYSQSNRFTIDVQEVVGENSGFWKAAGSDHLFYHVPRPSGQALLNRMQATRSHQYLRSHHTFKKDTNHGVPRGQDVYSEDEYGNPQYDFTHVNRVFTEYVKRGIKPIVEYDYLPRELEIRDKPVHAGNDEGMAMRNTGPNDWDKWSDLMKAATRNFIEVFGREEVRTWYFEVWNEPDGWPMDQIDVFYKMYDVFVDAVISVDSNLRVGGPACYHEYFLRPFLEHVTRGTNHVTGRKGTRIDFISYHIYGLSGKWLNTEPHIQPQVQRFTQSVLWLQRLLRDFPELRGTEFHINEWGLSSNYARTVNDHPDLAYRNTRESALFLVKLVNSLFQIEDNYQFPISLLLYWGFSWEADEDEFFAGKRELSTAGNIPKPIQTGFEMLAKLGEQRLRVERSAKDNRLGILATRSEGDSIALLAYNYDEYDQHKDKCERLVVDIIGLEANTGYDLTETSLDKTNNNTYTTWEKMGRPPASRKMDLRLMEQAGNLRPTGQHAFLTDSQGAAQIELTLEPHSMKLIQISKTNIVGISSLRFKGKFASGQMDDKIISHRIASPYQADSTTIRVLLPDEMIPGESYKVLYVLPVIENDNRRFGDGLSEIMKYGYHNEFKLICVAPEFTSFPWYADHATNLQQQDESHFLKTIIPFIDDYYPTLISQEGRLLMGFSKSGWGVFSLLLRHPEKFHRAAGWDIGIRVDTGPITEEERAERIQRIFGSLSNFEEYRISSLLKERGNQLGDSERLFYYNTEGKRGSGGIDIHRLMVELGIPHRYLFENKRIHRWDSGWIPEAVRFLVEE